MKRWYYTLGLGACALIVAIVSARLGIPYLAYGVVACTIAAMVLCAWGKLDARTTPYLVFLLGLAFLYQSTLISNGLIGTDIHTEYYLYNAALDGWDIGYPHAYNTAIGTTVIAPFLTNWLGVPGYWIYKAVFPFFFAFVPLLLYLVYRREFSADVAFLASVLFITVPTYLLEMIGLPRQMLGEIMLAFGVFLIVVQPWRKRYLFPVLAITLLGGYLFHYVMGAVILMMSVGCAAILAFIRFWGRRLSFAAVKISVVGLMVAVVVAALGGFSYYSQVAGGVVTSSLSGSAIWIVYRVAPFLDPHAPDTWVPPTSNAEIIPPTGENTEPATSANGAGGYFYRQEPLVRAALGLDFAEATLVGKLFRVFQYMIQALLLAGCVWLLVKRKRFSPEYISLAVVAILLLGACVLLPRFSNIINATRFYHIAMFMLAPLAVAGGLLLFRNLKRVVLLILIPYVLFTTGVVFELAKETDIGSVNAPYSIALSNHRIGAVAEYTDSDKAVADWIVGNDIEPILTDINGMLLLSQQKDPYAYIHRSTRTGRYYTVQPVGESDPIGMNVSELDRGWGFLPRDTMLLANGTYVFLTEQSMRTGTVTFKPGWYAMTDSASGMRVQYPLDFVGLPGEFIEWYRIGDAVVLRKDND